MKITEKRTKIITTIGPASETKEMILNLFKAGMSTIRLNFSHGDHEEQGARILLAQEIRKETKLPISILLDTKGPEIRVGKFKGGEQEVTEGQKITFYTGEEAYKTKECGPGEMTVAYDMSQDLAKGKVVLVDDGKLILDVISVKKGVIETKSRNTHTIIENKRVNLPGTKFSMPFLAEQDIIDIKFGAKMGIDFIAASFVNTPEDIMEIKTILKKVNSSHIKVIAKIESQYAVDHFKEIVAVADAIMIARGDLGLEIPYYEVPVAQKMMIRESRKLGKPVIVATQMLDSMGTNPSPTRAEVTDVYLATELGADATMLSGESASGDFPIIATETMAIINKRAEKEFYKKLFYAKQLEEVKKTSKGPRATIAGHVADDVIDGDIKYAVVLSRTGQLLETVAKFRPNTMILGITEDEKQVYQFGITSGVFMETDVHMFDKIKKDPKRAAETVKKFGGVKGDQYILVENNDVTKFTL